MDNPVTTSHGGTAPTLQDLARVIRPFVPDGYVAILFGSRATGHARPGSDWDIGLVGTAPLAGAALERIREALDALPTLHTFEVVDLSSLPRDFREQALRHAVMLV